MGRAGGLSAERPDAFLRAHAKEPLLPDRALRFPLGLS